jgi:ssDNA-binding Zn-finger/Zn-ribbon topoisomerase 1
MALRTAQKGKNSGKQFWGCTGYPECKKIAEV